MENEKKTDSEMPMGGFPDESEFGFRRSKLKGIPKIPMHSLEDICSNRVLELKTDCLNAFGTVNADVYEARLQNIGLPQGLYQRKRICAQD